MIEGFERLYQAVFLSSAMAFVVLERVRALQYQPVHIARRWTSNVGLFLIGSVATAVFLPIGIYAFAERQPPGLISKLGLPLFAELVLAFLLLDLWKYWEHRLLHRIPLLWRFHLVHHSDTEVDVTTSQRHHPVEVLLAAGVPFALISAVGLPAAAVGLYLLAASVVTLYSHANVRLPAFIDRALRNLIVTTRVHALHHSDLRAQTDGNYGLVLTIWDRLFGTYVDPEKARIPHSGLSYFHLPRDTTLFRVLSQPLLFRRDLEYPARDSAAPSLAAEPESWGLTLARDHIEPVVGAIIGCALVTWVAWPTPIEMTAVWRNSEAYQYAWLVLPMIVYLLGWHRRRRLYRAAQGEGRAYKHGWQRTLDRQCLRRTAVAQCQVRRHLSARLRHAAGGGDAGHPLLQLLQ
jgi:sterol desaturase/sphingolipid hydroxylase (fatty acid hydroxylase superfamily)